MHLDDLTVDLPDRDAAIAQAKARLAAFESASDAAAQIAVLKDFDVYERKMATLDSLSYIRFSQDTTNDDAKAARTFMDELAPAVDVYDVALRRAVLASPHLAELTQHLGENTVAGWRCDADVFSEAIEADVAAESALVMEFMALMASVTIEWEGETLSLGQARALMGKADRSIRAAAAKLRDEALGAHAEALDALYDKLTKLRHSMAIKQGYDSFTPMGYARMGRTDYSAEDVVTYRAQVLEHVVPLCLAIRKRRAEALGIDWQDYRVWDESVADPKGVPCPTGDHDWMIEQAKTMFSGLGEDFRTFFDSLLTHGLLDLKSRAGKSGGGYCAALYDQRVPFIFANFNGSQDDVNVFTHECGHAFQQHSSMHHTVMADIRPTAESAEIHSMSLEHLCYPHMELFFGDDADRYRRQHLEGALLFLPYGCAIDAFQHKVYENPTWTAQERRDCWLELAATWMPWRSNEGLDFAESGAAWQAQRHVYFQPFYYIDYCLAETVALQFWQLAETDRADAMTRYRKLCHLGGSKPFQALVDAVGLKSPLRAGTLESVVADAARALGL